MPTKTQEYLAALAGEGELPEAGCCMTTTQSLIYDAAVRVNTLENAISRMQQDYGIPHYSLYDLPSGTSWNSTTSDNFSVMGVDSPSDLFQGQFPPFVLDCSELGDYTDDDGDTTAVYNILMESGQLFVDEAPVEMFIGETFIPSEDDMSRGTQFVVIIQRDGDGVVLRTRARTIYRD